GDRVLRRREARVPGALNRVSTLCVARYSHLTPTSLSGKGPPMKKVPFAFALLLAALALAACGGGGATTGETTPPGGATAAGTTGGAEEEAGGGTAGGGGAVAIEADPSGSLAYTTEEANAKAGKVTIDFTNDSPVGHDVDVEDSSGESLIKTEII